MDPLEKTFKRENTFTKPGAFGLIAKNFPLEMGISYNWTVRVVQTEGCGREGPTLSVSVVTEEQTDSYWPNWGANQGWALAFWEGWNKSVFSHDRKIVKDLDLNHHVRSGDVVEVYLSEERDLSFTLNGNEVGMFPYQLPGKETLYPAIFTGTNGGEVRMKIEVESGLGIKPAKRT